MRTYYIYRQDIRYAALYDEIMGFLSKFRCKYFPYEYVGYIEGVKELYKHFTYLRRHRFEQFIFSKTFLYDNTEFCVTGRPSAKYIIIDDRGNIRDYEQLVRKYAKRKHYQKYRTPHQCNVLHFRSDIRREITPDDYREYKAEYGAAANLKAPRQKRHRFYIWNIRECHKKSRSWKDQTKRRKQWSKEMML